MPDKFDPTKVKLGKKLGRIEDPRTFKFRMFMPMHLPVAPSRSEFSRDMTSWPMYANDRFGDCTVVSHGHRIIAQERNAGQRETRLTDEDVLAVYSAVTGFDRNRPETDNGAYMLDINNYMRNVGIGREKDGTSHTISAYVSVNPRDPAEIRLASWIFGGVYLGIWLPKSAMRQAKWDVPNSGPTGDGEPGSWGGHAVFMSGYSAKQVSIITWARRQPATWNFIQTYCDEAYAIISEDFLRTGGKTRAGFDVAQLEGYLRELGQ